MSGKKAKLERKMTRKEVKRLQDQAQRDRDSKLEVVRKIARKVLEMFIDEDLTIYDMEVTFDWIMKQRTEVIAHRKCRDIFMELLDVEAVKKMNEEKKEQADGNEG